MNISRTLHVGRLQDGGWAAATDESPYLFFQGTTEHEVVAAAKEALEFCFSDRGAVATRASTRPQISLSQFFKKRTEHFFSHSESFVAAE